MTPQRLSHFELLDELGAGGMGVVYRARDLRLNRLVAVKVLPAAARGDGERRRFLAEAQSASGINHPAVVTIHEVDSDGGVDFIAMELVEGRSLAAELAGGPLPLARALRLAIALADGLASAHRLGLIHRDLKPGNLMLGPDDRLKILDFGLVKRIETGGEVVADAPTALLPESLTASGLLVGTPAYMSPEQARGDAVDARSDLFAFGCVLYEMLTGRRAFGGDNPVQVLSGVLTGEPAPVGGLPPELTGLLGRLFAKDRAARPPSAEAVRRELEAVLARRAGALPATVVVAPPPAPAARARRIVAVALTVALVAVGAYVYLSRPRGTAPYAFRLVSQSAVAERQAAFSPDGGSLAFVRDDDAGVAQLWIRSLAGGDPLQLTQGEAAVAWPDWSPVGDRIVYARAGDGIWEVPPLGGSPRRLVEHGARPRLSPDGARLYFVSQRRIWAANGDGSEPQPLAGIEPQFFGNLAHLAPSPDGRWLAYFWPHSRRPLGDLWRVPSEGGSPERLTDLGFEGDGVDWSADGRWIVFSSDHGGSRTLWRIAASGGEPEPITGGAGEDSLPRLSRDGRRIAYTNRRVLHSVERLDPASGRRTRIFERREGIILPTISHAGDRFAFFGRVPRAHHLFVLDLASGQAEQVTRGEGELRTHPRWSSDDRALYYYPEAPQHELRRIDLATGRDERIVPDWSWPTHSHASVSAGDREVAYLLRDTRRFVETRIRDFATGAERALPTALWGLHWFADGRRLVGVTHDGRVHRCDAVALSCEEITGGSYPIVSGDGRWLYLLRFPGPVAWRRELASGAEERLAELDGFLAISFGWGVLPSGELVWNRFEPGREELWIGELP